jgi:anti-sigma regulatory factor (Ser/Thr protein kinase)
MVTGRRADAVTGWGSMHHSEPGSGVGPASRVNTSDWPLQSHLELGALPSAVPSARLHARHVVAEWGLASIADTVELVVSELVTNGVKASQALDHLSPVWLGLAGNEHEVFVAVWDGNEEPVQASADSDELPDLEAEGGRGLLLVASLSTDWGVYWPEGSYGGKVVWSVITEIEATGSSFEVEHQSRIPLPRRVPTLRAVLRPVQAMDDLAVLERVREGLRGLE